MAGGLTGDSPAAVSGENQQPPEAGAREDGRSTTRDTGSRAPPDIPDGRDDDIVARQLREAAERETDPELREKLWQEYDKYKGNT